MLEVVGLQGVRESRDRLAFCRPLNPNSNSSFVLRPGFAQDHKGRQCLGIELCYEKRLTGLILAPHLPDLNSLTRLSFVHSSNLSMGSSKVNPSNRTSCSDRLRNLFWTACRELTVKRAFRGPKNSKEGAGSRRMQGQATSVDCYVSTYL